MTQSDQSAPLEPTTPWAPASISAVFPTSLTDSGLKPTSPWAVDLRQGHPCSPDGRAEERAALVETPPPAIPFDRTMSRCYRLLNELDRFSSIDPRPSPLDLETRWDQVNLLLTDLQQRLEGLLRSYESIAMQSAAEARQCDAGAPPSSIA